MKNEEKFKGFMVLMSEKYERKISKTMIQLVWEALKPFNDKECEEALRHVVFRGRFYKDLLPDLLEKIESLSPPKSGTAWTQLLKATQEYYPGFQIDFEDKRISPIVKKMGGFSRFVHMTDKELTWIQKEFEQRYIEESVPAPFLSEGRDKEGIKRLEILTKKAVG